ALWLVFLGLLVIVFTGAMVDYAGMGARAFQNAPSHVLQYFVVAIMLDRTVAALREALHASDERRGDMDHWLSARERAQAKLEHAKQVEATGQRAGAVAHAFKNVLSVSLGYAQRRERLADREKAALVDALSGVEAETRRAPGI